MPWLQRRNRPRIRRELEFESCQRREFHPVSSRPRQCGAADAVEVRTQANVIDARDFNGVVDMLKQPADRNPPQLADPMSIDAADGRAWLGSVSEFRRLGFDRLLLRLVILESIIPIRKIVIEEAFKEVDVHYTAVFGQGVQHIICHVAGHIIDRPAG